MFNAQSVVNKLSELHHILYTNNYNIVFITESWLHAGIDMGLLDPCRYSHRCLRGWSLCAY